MSLIGCLEIGLRILFVEAVVVRTTCCLIDGFVLVTLMSITRADILSSDVLAAVVMALNAVRTRPALIVD